MRVKWPVLITLVVELQSFTSLVPKSSTPAKSHHHERIRTDQETRRQPRDLQKEDRRNPRVNVRGEESQPAAAILKGRRCRTLCWGGLVTCTRESDRLAPIAVNTSVICMNRRPSCGRGSLLKRELDLVDIIQRDRQEQEKIIKVLHGSLLRKEEEEMAHKTSRSYRGRRSRSRDRDSRNRSGEVGSNVYRPVKTVTSTGYVLQKPDLAKKI